MDDLEAVRQLKHGNIQGLEALVRRYQTRAVRAAYLITHDVKIAEDVVQDAFIRAYECIGQFDETRPFGPWFLRSVVNRALKVLGREQKLVTFDPANLPFLIDNADERDTREAVETALQSLSPEQRASIVMHYYLDLSEREIATQTNVPQGTVKWRLYQARKRLRALLQPVRHVKLTTRE